MHLNNHILNEATTYQASTTLRYPLHCNKALENKLRIIKHNRTDSIVVLQKLDLQLQLIITPASLISWRYVLINKDNIVTFSRSSSSYPSSWQLPTPLLNSPDSTSSNNNSSSTKARSSPSSNNSKRSTLMAPTNTGKLSFVTYIVNAEHLLWAILYAVELHCCEIK